MAVSGKEVISDQAKVLSRDQLELMHAWWRAANYLSVGQIYLLDNPLLREPLKPKHVKPRLLGHWGTAPGLNFIYVHLNRAAQPQRLDRAEDGRWAQSRQLLALAPSAV